jgi:hypothetical protein
LQFDKNVRGTHGLACSLTGKNRPFACVGRGKFCRRLPAVDSRNDRQVDFNGGSRNTKDRGKNTATRHFEERSDEKSLFAGFS